SPREGAAAAVGVFAAGAPAADVCSPRYNSNAAMARRTIAATVVFLFSVPTFMGISLSLLQESFYPDLQLDNVALLLGERNTVHNQEHLFPFRGINEFGRAWVIAGDRSIDVQTLQPRD